ncbi:MAG: DUF2273 domain-containing protein [Rubrobacteraceae bacterium]
MGYWTNKQWGALIGAALIILISQLGIGITAIVFIFGVLGYFIGSYLDGDFDLDDIRERAQGRRRRSDV